MFSEKKIAFSAGIGLAVLLLAITAMTQAGVNTNPPNELFELSVNTSSDRQTDWWHWYNPAGTWVRSDSTCVLTCTPASAWHGRFSVTSECIVDPTFEGFFPMVVDKTIDRGDMVRTGLNTYDTSLFAYAVDQDYEYVYFVVFSGTSVMTTCNTIESIFYMAVYSPDQDPFGEDPPAYGCYGPTEVVFERIPVVPPCDPVK